MNKVVVSHPEYYSKTLDVTGATSYGFVSLVKIPAAPVLVPEPPVITDADNADLEKTVTPPSTTPYPSGGGGGGGANGSGSGKFNWFWVVVGVNIVIGYVLKGSKPIPPVI
jgi:hypothetical protein